MNKQIPYTTVEEQIALLESKGLSFRDKNLAAEQLNMYGYYNIINSYKAPYLQERDGKKEYIPGTTYEQLFSLFIFDHNLRNAIMAAMLDLEEHIRAVAADVIAQSFGTNHNDYLRWNNYRDRRVTHQRFSLRNIIETLQKNLMSDKDPIKYYREQYNLVPPWILFKGTYFSTLVNFIRLFKEPQKQAVVKKIYNCPDDICSATNVKNLLLDTLFLSLEYRNLAAHGGRVYNYEPKYDLQFTYSSELEAINPCLEEVKDKYGISKLLILLQSLKYDKPLKIIETTITDELHRHLSHYPTDYSIIGNAVGIIIYSKEDVLIVHEGKEYPIKVIRQSNDASLITIENVPHELQPLFNPYMQCDKNNT